MSDVTRTSSNTTSTLAVVVVVVVDRSSSSSSRRSIVVDVSSSPMRDRASIIWRDMRDLATVSSSPGSRTAGLRFKRLGSMSI
jgi:hypothetical protein